ncbi:ankyrin repeat-containing domain protein [Tirmania nivea]|nr:ankyrin repeat-containing domain protein [Tirmania nivea]
MRTPKSQKPKQFFKDLLTTFRPPKNKRASNSVPVLDAQISTSGPGGSSSNAITSAAPLTSQQTLSSTPSTAPTTIVVDVNKPSNDHEAASALVTQPPHNAFQEAIQKYVDELSEDDKSAFLLATDIMTKIQELNKSDGPIRLPGSLNARVVRILQGIKQFMSMVSIFTQQAPQIASLAIGGANCVLKLVLGYFEFFESLTGMMERIGEHLEYLSKYGSAAFQKCPDVQKALVNAYCDLLDFFVSVRNVFTDREGKASYRLGFKLFMKLAWEPFEQKFKPIEDQFLHHTLIVVRSANVQHLIEAYEAREQQDSKEGDERRRAVLNWLSQSDFEDTHQRHYKKRFGSTGKWLLDDLQFTNWVNQSNSGLLWCHGTPGAGKTVLASLVVEHLSAQYELSGNIGVTFLYCNYKEPREPVTYIRLALKQLCRRIKNLPAELLELYKKHFKNDSEPSLEELRILFIAVSQHFDCVFLTVDALDECSISQRRDLCDFLKRIVNASTAIGAISLKAGGLGTIKLFVTSRKEADIACAFSEANFPRIEIEARKVDKDIEVYARAQIDQRLQDRRLVLQDIKLKDEILDALIGKSGGMFLWIEFQLQEICDQTSDYGIKKTLGYLPEDMDATYERIINMINKKPRAHRELARKVLMWIAFAQRPLGINELTTAAAMDQRYGALLQEHAIVHVEPNELLSRRPTPETILAACANLIMIDTENFVRFVHFSVQEFLLGGRSPVVAGLKLEQEAAHAEMALDCISFLMLFPTPISVDPWAPNRGQTILYPGTLANYACLSWPLHIRALSSTRLNHELMAVITKFMEFGPIIKERHINGRVYHYQFNHGVRFSPATFALILDLPLVYQHYCNLGFKWGEETQKWPDDKLAMHYAVYENDLFMAKRLYEAGHPVDHFHLADQSSMYAKMLTPLFGVEYSEEMATFLLDRGASVNPQPSVGSIEELKEIERHISKSSELARYPLQAEARQGNLKLMRLLVGRGADVNAQGGRYGNALQFAAYAGQLEVVQFLLDNGAKVNAEGGEFGYALQAACVPIGIASENDLHDHRVKIAQLLLDHGADVNALGGEFGTAFLAAANYGNLALVQLLLENGANENAQGGLGGSALTAAARGKHTEVVNLLLERGADVNAEGGRYGYALQAAAMSSGDPPNDLKLMCLLLDSGAAINALGGVNGSALAAAARCASFQIVQMLLDRGADVSAQGGIYGTTLQAAAAARPPRLKIVQLLLDRGAKVNTQCGQYGTALQAAALSGSYELVKLLLDNGAVADIQGGYYGNSLQAAAHGRYDFQGQRNRGRILELIQLLLDRGVDVNAQGGHYGNALQAAVVSPRSGTLNYQVIELLLDKGAQVNALGGHYGHVLQAAAHGAYSPDQRYETVKVLEILQLLLDRGADVNAQGGKFGNVMRAALAPTSHANLKLKEAVIALLLRNGCRAEDNPSDSTPEHVDHNKM